MAEAITATEAVAARIDIVDRLNALPAMGATDADFVKMSKVCADAVAEIEAMRRGYRSLTRAIEREGYAVLVDVDGNFSLERITFEESGDGRLE